MLLAKANELLAEDKLDEAYGYLRFLEENYPNLADLAGRAKPSSSSRPRRFTANSNTAMPWGCFGISTAAIRTPRARRALERHDGEIGRSIRCRG